MTKYFKAEANGKTALRSSANATYTAATVWTKSDFSFTEAMWSSRMELAVKNADLYTRKGYEGLVVVEVTEITKREFNMLTTVAKTEVALFKKARFEAALAEDPTVAAVMALAPEVVITPAEQGYRGDLLASHVQHKIRNEGSIGYMINDVNAYFAKN